MISLFSCFIGLSLPIITGRGRPFIRTSVFFYYFLAIFKKDSYKYAPANKILKNEPSAWRHRYWRQDYTPGASAFGVNVLAHVGIDADVTFTWQRAWRQ
jgi:hypothetical protein